MSALIDLTLSPPPGTEYTHKSTIGLRVNSPLNQRKHWRALLGAKRQQRDAGSLLAYQALKHLGQGFLRNIPWLRVEVTLTRVGARKMDDDNVAASFKSVRDGIAEWCGLDDGDDRWTWKCDQRSGSKVYAVEAVFVVGRAP